MEGIDESDSRNLKELRDAERQYRRLFEAAKDGILILNSETGEIEDVNPFLEQLLGYSREEFIGMKLWEVGPFRDVPACKTAYEQLQAQEYIRYHDLPLETREGERVSVEFVSNVYAVNGGNVIQCNIRDITVHKAMAQELQRAKEEAEQANEAKTRFIEMLSHELRTPLNPMMMLIHAWKTEKRLPPELLPDLEIMQRSIEIERQLIDDLLDVTAITKGKIKLEFGRQDVHELLPYAVEVIQDQIDERKLKIEMALHATRSIVNTDFVRLAQVLWNLTKNAVKFTPAGGTITISTADVGPCIRIGIGDTGIGIPQDALAGVFEAFAQGTHEGFQGSGGLGLGLTIAKKLLELLGGTIEVQSDGTGKGTRFTLLMETVNAA
ncbi:MAG: type restriction enzyme protein [Chthoniobacter sp.]|jgi:PAS domain S-box-containing protein|nr:type restriction enzyme protein [Chthoniobacter sp.]